MHSEARGSKCKGIKIDSLGVINSAWLVKETEPAYIQSLRVLNG